MSLFEAAVHGLHAQVEHLDSDLKVWKARASETGDLPVHKSQVTRLDAQLRATLEATTSGKPLDLGVRPPFQGTVADLPRLRRDIGTVHLLWEFFRDKLAQRDVATFKTHLGAADDLAWACYQPFLEAATSAHPEEFPLERVKEPPLVFYTTDRVPFAQARSKVFHPLGLDAKDLATFAEVLQSLPVPVIGVPWTVANRVPELVLVGHETGHVVAEDLGFGSETQTALETVALPKDPEGARREVWVSWGDEVFADITGCIATGRAFVAGLAGELAGNPIDIEQAPIDKKSPGKYPTPLLRMAMCEAALTAIGVEPNADWSGEYPAMVGDSTEFKDDIDLVAASLLDRRWVSAGGKRLTEILPWDASHEASAESVKNTMLQEAPAKVPFDVRVWVAASMLAARSDPEEYAGLRLDSSFVEGIVGQRAVAVRSSEAAQAAVLFPAPVTRGPVTSMPQPQPVDPEEALKRADRAAGLDIAAKLGLGQWH